MECALFDIIDNIDGKNLVNRDHWVLMSMQKSTQCVGPRVQTG